MLPVLHCPRRSHVAPVGREFKEQTNANTIHKILDRKPVMQFFFLLFVTIFQFMPLADGSEWTCSKNLGSCLQYDSSFSAFRLSSGRIKLCATVSFLNGLGGDVEPTQFAFDILKYAKQNGVSHERFVKRGLWPFELKKIVDSYLKNKGQSAFTQLTGAHGQTEQPWLSSREFSYTDIAFTFSKSSVVILNFQYFDKRADPQTIHPNRFLSNPYYRGGHYVLLKKITPTTMTLFDPVTGEEDYNFDFVNLPLFGGPNSTGLVPRLHMTSGELILVTAALEIIF